MKQTTSLCYLLIAVLSLILLVVGSLDLIVKQRETETSYEETISRQLRGVGYVVLALAVVVVGGAVCHSLMESKMKL